MKTRNAVTKTKDSNDDGDFDNNDINEPIISQEIKFILKTISIQAPYDKIQIRQISILKHAFLYQIFLNNSKIMTLNYNHICNTHLH
jgi:hypothetical protein